MFILYYVIIQGYHRLKKRIEGSYTDIILYTPVCCWMYTTNWVTSVSKCI